MKITDRLDQIEARAGADVPTLVAALRAVLDLCDEAADPPGVSGFEVGMAAMSQKVRNAIGTALEDDL